MTAIPLPSFSVVLPVYNEEDVLPQFLPELKNALSAYKGTWEIVAVDDGSKDASAEILAKFAEETPQLRVVKLCKNSGQSAAMWVGFQEATGDWIGMLDSDGQNVPADLLLALKTAQNAGADMCCGFRANRRDTFSKRIGSKMANAVRRHFLQDGIRDTGCSLKVCRARFLKRMGYWNGMHRFFPALAIMQGAKIVQTPVNHRARLAGKSKYTNFGRLCVTVRDLKGVAWLRSRAKALAWTIVK